MQHAFGGRKRHNCSSSFSAESPRDRSAGSDRGPRPSYRRRTFKATMEGSRHKGQPEVHSSTSAPAPAQNIHAGHLIYCPCMCVWRIIFGWHTQTEPLWFHPSMQPTRDPQTSIPNRASRGLLLHQFLHPVLFLSQFSSGRLLPPVGNCEYYQF